MSNYSFNIPRLFKAFSSSRSFSSLVRALLSSVVVFYCIKRIKYYTLCSNSAWKGECEGKLLTVAHRHWPLCYFIFPPSPVRPSDPSVRPTRPSIRPVRPSDPSVRPTRLSVRPGCLRGNRAKMPASGLWLCWTSREVSDRVLITKLSNTAAWFNLYSVKK